MKLSEYLYQPPDSNQLKKTKLCLINTDLLHHFTDFTGSDFEITNVSQAAYAALYEFAQESVDFNELENLLENA